MKRVYLYSMTTMLIINFQNCLAVELITKNDCDYTEKEIVYKSICGNVLVPESHYEATTVTIEIPYQLVKSSSIEADQLPTILVIGGGPGMSNMNFPVWNQLLAKFNVLIVGFRGVDGNVNLSCREFDEVFSQTNRLFAQSSISGMKQVLRECFSSYEKSGYLLKHINPKETIADFNRVKTLLGIKKMHILSGSFGTRLAQYYMNSYPDDIERAVLISANPPDRTVWEVEQVDNKLKQLSAVCALDDICSSKTNNLYLLVLDVMNNMPEQYMGLEIDPARVGISTFSMLYSVDTMPLVLDAYIDASNGNYTGLMVLSQVHDSLVKGIFSWGHLLLMASSVDFEVNRDYYASLASTKTSYGSPLAR